jgi:hypothetical protein
MRQYMREPLTDYDLSFLHYLEDHRESRLLSCQFKPGGGMIFCPDDSTGIWAGRMSETVAKGLDLPKVIETALEIAAKKGLVTTLRPPACA